MAVQNQYSGAWCFDIYASGGNIYAATTDLYKDAWVTTLGQFYRGLCLTPGMSIGRALSHGFYGVDLPQAIEGVKFTARIYDQAAGTWTTIFDRTLEWRNVRVSIRRFDFEANTVTSARFAGVIRSAVFSDGCVTFGFGSHIDTVMDKMIPAYTINAADTGFDEATDHGAAIPVPYGRSIVRPPYVKLDDTATTSDPGGYDYVLGWGSATAGRHNIVLNVWDNVDKYQDALDKLSGFQNAPGSPTYASASTFTVADSSYSNVYAVGTPIRLKTTASGSDYIYGYVYGFSGTTVTVSGSMTLDAGLSGVQIGGEYLIEESRYSKGGVNITSMRMHSTPQGGVLCDISDRRTAGAVTTTNPANVIKDIMEASTSTYGLGETCNATTFSTAATALSTAGLGSAFNGAIGWDGRQVRFGDFLADVLSWRGMRLIYDGANSQWDLYVDSSPSASGVTFGYNDGTYNNVKRVVSLHTTPTTEAVKTLTLKYGRQGRRVGAGFQEAQDYLYKSSFADVLTVGTERFITSDYLGPPVSLATNVPDHTAPRRVLSYRAKRLKRSDQKAVIEVGQEIHDVDIGQTCTFIDTPDGISSSTWFIAAVDERLDGGYVTLWGYNADIYTDTYSSDTTAVTEPTRDDGQAGRDDSNNLLPNPDFSPVPRATMVPVSGNVDYTSMPGWHLYQTTFASSYFSSITRTSDTRAKGGTYLTVVVTGTHADFPRMAATYANDYTGNGRFECEAGQSFMFSFYADQTNILGLRVRFMFYDDGVLDTTQNNLRLHIMPNDTNALGYKRMYAKFRAPSGCNSFTPELCFTKAGTFNLDAFQVEKVNRHRPRPTEWRPSIRPYVAPTVVGVGDHRVMYDDDDVSGGTYVRVRVSADTTLSGSSTNVLGSDGAELIPAGAIVLAVTGRTKTNITYGGGGSTFAVGTANDTDWWGSGLSKNTAADRFGPGMSGVTVTGGTARLFNSATHVRLTPNTGTFSGGAVKLLLHYIDCTAPTIQ